MRNKGLVLSVAEVNNGHYLMVYGYYILGFEL